MNDELEKLQELVRLVEMEFTNHLTEGPNGYCPDDESVSADVAGDSPLTFGHIRRARAAVNALPELLAERDRLREALQPFIRSEDDFKGAPDNAPYGVYVKIRDLRRARAALNQETKP